MRRDTNTQRFGKTVWPGTLIVLGHMLLGLGGCTQASSGGTETQSVSSPHPLLEFQSKEDRLFQIGYRLSSSNAPFCKQQTSTLGIILHDARAYSQPSAVRTFFGLTGDIGVQSVAAGSPAAQAGLTRNDTILAIDDNPVAAMEVDDRDDWRRAKLLRETLAETARDGSVSVNWRDQNGSVTQAQIESVAICSSVFELLSGNDQAVADGTRVLVGEGFPGFAYPDDELAAVLAHEMAHNLLGHIEELTVNSGGGRTRLSERDADRLMPWLLKNAGYDPAAAVRMMEKFGPRHGGGLLRDRSHDGWDERVEFIAAELEKISAVSSRSAQGTPRANWRENFEPFLN